MIMHYSSGNSVLPKKKPLVTFLLHVLWGKDYPSLQLSRQGKFPLLSYSENQRNYWEWRTGGAAAVLKETKQAERAWQLRAATPLFLLLQAF